MRRYEAHCQSYLHALKLSPGHPLASQGLKKLYVKHERWESLGKMLQQSVQAAYDACVSSPGNADHSRDGDKLQSSLQELLDLYVEHGPESKVRDMTSG